MMRMILDASITIKSAARLVGVEAAAVTTGSEMYAWYPVTFQLTLNIKSDSDDPHVTPSGL